MTGEIINLKQARKAKARTDKDQKAAENRRLHGRTKAEKTADRATKDKAASHIDGHKRER